MSKIECIYLDMDGVIADFVSPSLVAAFIPLTHDKVTRWGYYDDYMTSLEFWRRINRTADFWFNITPYEWAKSLVMFCKSVAPVYFCSSPVVSNHCASQKLEWLLAHGFMSDGEDNFVLTPHKEQLAGPGRVLIDDGTHQIAKFVKAGGHGILFPQPWNEYAGLMLDSDDDEAKRHEIVVGAVNWYQKFLNTGVQNVHSNADIHSTVKQDVSVKDTNVVKDSNPKDGIGTRKPGISALPCAPIFEAGAALDYGGRKYGRHNWRAIGVRNSVYYDAAMRHLTAWWEGEDLDPVESGGSGLPHIAHAIAGLMVLRDSEIIGNNTDDRPVRTASPSSRLVEAVEAIHARFPNPVPPFTQVVNS